MKIKRFFAADMRQAIRLVRSQQGPEAVILSSRAVDGGVEVISADDYDQNVILDMALTVNPNIENKEREEKVTLQSSQAMEDTPPESLAQTETPDHDQLETQDQDQLETQEHSVNSLPLQSLQLELASMRELLNDQLLRLVDDHYVQNQPVNAHHMRRLQSLGFSQTVARQIVDALGVEEGAAKSWRDVLHQIIRIIPVIHDDILRGGGTIVLVGPTGVGKTTTLAKFAARFTLSHSHEQVAIVTTDNIRVGAQKQFQAYGHILCVPVYMANPDELTRILDGAADRKLVLIDTAGIGPRDPQLSEWLEALSTPVPVKTFLTLAANTQRKALEAVIRSFRRSGLRLEGCILTKVDEAVALGDVLSVIIEQRLPLAYFTDGQRIPHDLHHTHAADLLTRLLMLAQSIDKSAVERTPPLHTFGHKLEEVSTDVLA